VYLSKIENGVMPPPSEKVILRLAEALNIDKDELIALAGKVPSDIAKLLSNQEALQFLRSPGAKRIIGASSRMRRNLQMVNRSFFNSRKALPRVALAIALVLAVAGSLWFASPVPVKAVDVSLPNLPSVMYSGTTYSFYAQVDINSNEQIPITNFRLDITGPTTVYAVFNVNGTITSQSGQFVSITPVVVPYYDYSFGYGYGYGYKPSLGYSSFSHSWGYGYGYGYGYGVGLATQAKYLVTLNTTGMVLGSYTAQLAVNTGPGAQQFLSPVYSFTLSPAQGGGAPPPSAPPTSEQVEAMPTQQAAAAEEAMTTEQAATVITEVTTEKAADIIATVTTDKAAAVITAVTADKAATIIEKVETVKAANIITQVETVAAGAIIEKVEMVKAADIMSQVEPVKAAAVMETLTTNKLTDIIPKMSEQALTERLPGLTPEKLYSVDPQVLFASLPNVPTEQLISEEPPQPPAQATAPVAVYTTPSGARYLAVQTWAGEWVVVMATPKPIDQLMIKTKQALTDVETTVDIFETRPSYVTVGLPAGQIVRAYFDIGFENATPEDIELGHITFQVEKTWLEQNSVQKWSVALNRYDPELGQWITLPTKRVREDTLYVYYTATITQFSTFAISGSQTLPAVTAEVSNLVVNPVAAKTGEAITISASKVSRK